MPARGRGRPRCATTRATAGRMSEISDARYPSDRSFAANSCVDGAAEAHAARVAANRRNRIRAAPTRWLVNLARAAAPKKVCL